MSYLIPAGSKKQLLIFGLFKPFELAIFGVGLTATIIMLFILSPDNFIFAVVDLLPAMITGFLVLPIPHYHNAYTVMKEAYIFYTTRQRFIWKGWCVKDEFKK